MSRPLVLAATLAAAMSAIFVLPQFRQVESALDIDLGGLPPLSKKVVIPLSASGDDAYVFDRGLGPWLLMERPPSKKELQILAQDTKFSNAVCALPRIEQRSPITGETRSDIADLSIVLSGYDLANSIHRPERCLPAQGHKILRSEVSELELRDGRTIPVTRLLTQRSIPTAADGSTPPVVLNCIVYYFFVGCERITASHTNRTLIDIKDRVLRGEAQRWAYVSGFISYGDDEQPDWWGPLNREQADKKIRQLLAELAENKIDWSVVKP